MQMLSFRNYTRLKEKGYFQHSEHLGVLYFTSHILETHDNEKKLEATLTNFSLFFFKVRN